MVRLTEEPINPASAYAAICSAFSGSVLFHYAVVKKMAGTGGATVSIDYSVDGNALLEMEQIAVELERCWNLEDVLLIRRTGRLAVGEIISLVAASSPGSDDAFEACRAGIGMLKKMTTIRKTEIFDNCPVSEEGENVCLTGSV